LIFGENISDCLRRLLEYNELLLRFRAVRELLTYEQYKRERQELPTE